MVDVSKVLFRGSQSSLCGNCLEYGADKVDVGPDVGTQRDPERLTVALCQPCRDALLTGAFDVLNERYVAERTVRRPPRG